MVFLKNNMVGIQSFKSNRISPKFHWKMPYERLARKIVGKDAKKGILTFPVHRTRTKYHLLDHSGSSVMKDR